MVENLVKSSMRIYAVARLVVLDGLRRHAVIGLVFFSLLAVGGGFLFFDFIPKDIGRASTDFLLSIIWVSGMIFLLFHAVEIAAWDNERGALHIYLARPVSRTEYVLAVFTGLAFLLLLLNIILGTGGWFVLGFIQKGVGEEYFHILFLSRYVLTIMGVFLIQMSVLAVIIFLSSLIRGSFPVLLLTLCYYFICSGLPVVRQSVEQNFIAGSDSSFLLLSLKGLTAVFPDFSWLDFREMLISTEGAIALGHSYAPVIAILLYSAIILTFACSVFERRDLQ